MAVRPAGSFVQSYGLPVLGKVGGQNSLDAYYFLTLYISMSESLRKLGVVDGAPTIWFLISAPPRTTKASN